MLLALKMEQAGREVNIVGSLWKLEKQEVMDSSLLGLPEKNATLPTT